jgi:hypothetical protein
MKKYLLFVFLLPVVFAPKVIAQGYSENTRMGEDIVEIRKDEVIENDYFITGDTVNVNGEVKGDLYAAGGTVNISGKVDGDLLVAGGTVIVSGEVTQDIRAAGGNIVISGVVGRNVTSVGGNVEIAKSAKIVGSLATGAGNLDINSEIPGNVNVAAGSVQINSNVGGNVDAGVGQLTITSVGGVGGDVSYYSDTDATIDKSASISGVIIRKDPAVHLKGRSTEDARNRVQNFGKAFGKGVRLIGFLSALLIGFIMVRFFPKCLLKVSDTLKSNPLRSSGYGLLTLFGVPVFSIMLMITIIGIPISFIVVALYLIYIYLVKVFFSYSLGQFLVKKANIKTNDYIVLTIGLIFYTLISFIPFFGGLFKFVILIAGLGAMVISSRQSYFEIKKKGIL